MQRSYTAAKAITARFQSTDKAPAERQQSASNACTRTALLCSALSSTDSA